MQFWITDYESEALHFNKKEIIIGFTFICISAPTTGAMVGAELSNRIGGLNSKKALPIVLISSLLGFAMCLCLPLCNGFWSLNLLLWANFFNGGILVIIMVGCIINCLPVENRAKGNALATFCYNLFGYLPSPYIYG